MSANFGDTVTSWAERTTSVSGLILIGSRERPKEDLTWRADAQSDWDFQIITSEPGMFANRYWIEGISKAKLRAYAVRPTVIGGLPKVNVVLSNTEADFVIIPARAAQLLRSNVARGEHHRDGNARRQLQDLAEVIRPGWRFLKGSRQWGQLYRRAVADVPDPRLDNEAVRQMAEGFVCDFVWTIRKLERGELRTAQRMLFRELAEVNLQLLHELKQRRGERTFTKARRIEFVASDRELASVTLEAPLQKAALLAAIEKSAGTCRNLVQELVGDSWRWPALK